MEIVKDLTHVLSELEQKDRFYDVKATLTELLAPQDPKTVRPYTYKKTPWGRIERIESQEEGTPTELTAPKKKRKVRTGESEVKTGQCWSFSHKDGKIYLPWGGSWGIFKTAWRRTLEAKQDRYTNPKLDLIKVYPRILPVEGKIDSMEEDNEPKVVLTPRHVKGKDSVRVEEFFDWISGKRVEFYIEVDSESPINEEKFIGMVKSLNTLDSFGPSKRGEVRVDEVEQVKLGEEDLQRIGV